MSRQPLRAVIFDYGHTLLDVRWDDGARERGERRLLAELGDPVGRGPFHAAVESELARAQSAAGEHAEVDYPRVAAAALRRLAVVPDPAALERGIRCEVLGSAEVRFPHPQAAGVLRELRRMGLRLAIVSNTPDPPPLVLELIEGDGLGELVDAILLSSALGLRKPAPAVYAAALEAVGAEPGETLFVGDRV
ncbi:MAG TPA: HAD family hydrolase, partial [Gaiellales bacterium]|nr:HAD family hydrolase [Gaiellales bacterium]